MKEYYGILELLIFGSNKDKTQEIIKAFLNNSNLKESLIIYSQQNKKKETLLFP
jgi:hypothetical protein